MNMKLEEVFGLTVCCDKEKLKQEIERTGLPNNDKGQQKNGDVDDFTRGLQKSVKDQVFYKKK